MNKNKIEIIILIIILTFGVNYAIFTYYVQPKYQRLVSAKAQLSEKQTKLNLLKVKKGQLESLKIENEKIKSQVEELNQLTSKQVDTPQLVYDFYMSCKKYNISGEDMNFQLLNSEGLQNPAIQSQSSVPQTNAQQGSTPPANAQQGDPRKPSSNVKDTGVNVMKLTITLRVNGEKKRIEEYIKNLYGITNRKLNVKSIALTPQDDSRPGEINSTQSNIPPANAASVTIPNIGANQNVSVASSIVPQESFSLVKASNLHAEIVFYQYILVDETNAETIKNYQFDHTKIGFESISDMFGTAKGK